MFASCKGRTKKTVVLIQIKRCLSDVLEIANFSYTELMYNTGSGARVLSSELEGVITDFCGGLLFPL